MFYNCAATVRKSENTPWVRLLIFQFCSVTQWKYTVTWNTASSDNLDVNVSPCMSRWEIKALFVNCDAWWFWMHLLHFRSCFYYQAEEIASVSFSLIKKRKSILAVFSPSFFSAFLSHRGTCDERALLMWSCRDPFHCQQHRFLCRTLSDEFACFRCCLCVLLCVHPLPWLCMWKYFLIQVGPYFCVFRCMSCVSSQWGCQWNTQDHTCSEADNSVVVSHIIKHRQVSSFWQVKDSFLSCMCMIDVENDYSTSFKGHI